MNEADFIQAINQNPADHNLQLVYADWLDERGDLRAEAWRVLVERGLFPTQITAWPDKYEHNKPPPGFGLWRWQDRERFLKVLSHDRCFGNRRTYFLAMDDAAVAWVRLHRDPDFALPEEAEA